MNKFSVHPLELFLEDVPEGHPQVGLISEGQRGVADTFEVGESILEDRQVVRHTSGDGRLDKVVFHEDYWKPESQ